MQVTATLALRSVAAYPQADEDAGERDDRTRDGPLIFTLSSVPVSSTGGPSVWGVRPGTQL